MEELINRFPNGLEYYNNNALFNRLIQCIYNGMSIETALIECIKYTEKQNKQIIKIVENQPPPPPRPKNIVSEEIHRDGGITIENKENIYYHPEAGYGKFIRRFNNPIYGESIIIELKDGRQYYAPSIEFTNT